MRIAAPADYGKDIHVHVPDGAIPKDGPSAGLAMAIALASAAHSIPVRSDTAISGEVTLTGQVLAVGAVREKLLAAKRSDFARVVMPSANRPEIERFSDEVTDGLNICFVSDVTSAWMILRA